jgi:hypothetical protein
MSNLVMNAMAGTFGLALVYYVAAAIAPKPVRRVAAIRARRR